MVQRKEVINKHLGIKPTTNNSITTEKRQQTHTKLTLQNHDTNSKVADFKAIKMKKSRSDSEAGQRVSLRSHVIPRQPGKPPPRVTPSCKKTSPNYMKSTSSSEARKEKTTEKTKTILRTSNVQKVVKTLTKTCSFKKIRTLTKVPSFKPTKTSTCSSTLKDSKFPPYLELNPGSTESQGKSKLRVCSYNHCSLNNHHHNTSPPLKRFIYLRRLHLKSQKVNRPEVLSPRKRKFSSDKTPRVVNPIEDFLVDFFVQDKEVDTQVSERLSDGPRSEIDSMDNLDQNEHADSSDMNFISEEGYSLSSVQNKASFSPSVSSEEFCGNSDIEWEEGKNYATMDNVEIPTESHCSDDQSKPDSETENSFSEYLEDLHQYSPYFQDEIVELLCFSDACSLADCKEIVEGPVINEKDELHSSRNNEEPEENSTPTIEATIYIAKLEDESDVDQGGIFSNLFEEVKQVENEDLNSDEDSLKFNGDQSDEDKYVVGEIREENITNFVKEERELIEEMINNTPQISGNSEALSTERETCKGSDDGQSNSSGVKLHSHDDNVVEENISDFGENHCTELDEILETMNKSQNPTKWVSNKGESYTNQELLENCNKLRMVMRSRKDDNDVEEEREFNPRGPNFLDIEPDLDAEKVDLRHQEMDDRRNAEEWMIDYALQKRVNQLALARKKKVELLVEAFEAVLPISKYES